MAVDALLATSNSHFCLKSESVLESRFLESLCVACASSWQFLHKLIKLLSILFDGF